MTLSGAKSVLPVEFLKPAATVGENDSLTLLGLQFCFKDKLLII